MSPDQAIKIVKELSSGRTRYEGQKPFVDEVLVAEIDRLRALTKCDSCGEQFDENGGCCEPCFSKSLMAHLKPIVAERDRLRAENERLRNAYNDALQRIAALVRDGASARQGGEMKRMHGLCTECGLSRDLAEDYDKVRNDLEGCETDYTTMREENDRLRAEVAELRIFIRNIADCDDWSGRSAQLFVKGARELLDKIDAPPGKEE